MFCYHFQSVITKLVQKCQPYQLSVFRILLFFIMKSRLIQEHERLKEEITRLRQLRETDNLKIKQLEQQKQTLQKAAKFSANQLAALNAEKARDFIVLKYFNKSKRNIIKNTAFPPQTLLKHCFCSDII